MPEVFPFPGWRMTRSSRFRVFAGVLLTVLVAALALAAWFLIWKPAGLPAPGTPRYEQYVEAFDVGVAALDVDRSELAQTKLSTAIELVPGEPAALADRGLLYLRLNQPDQ